MKLSGFRSRVEINIEGTGVLFLGVASWNFNDTAQALDSSCTEGYLGHGQGGGTSASRVGTPDPALPISYPTSRFGQRTSGQSVATLQMTQATLNEDNNPLPLGTLALRTGMGAKIRIWPNRDVAFWHLFRNAIVTEVSRDGEVAGLQSLRLGWECDGPYLLWTAVNAT